MPANVFFPNDSLRLLSSKHKRTNETELLFSFFNYRLSFSAPFVKIITHTFNGCT